MERLVLHWSSHVSDWATRERGLGVGRMMQDRVSAHERRLMTTATVVKQNFWFECLHLVSGPLWGLALGAIMEL